MSANRKTNTVFISHGHADAEVAVALKELIEDAFGALSVFVSSDSRSLPLGAKWFEVMAEALSKADLILTLLSPTSITRPWVNFEAGAAFGRDKQLVPICVRGLSKNHVGPPLSSYQVLEVTQPTDLHRLIERISGVYRRRMKPDPTLIDKVFGLAKPSTRHLPPPLTPQAEQNESRFLDGMQAEIDGLMLQRKVFWETLERVYVASFTAGKVGYPPTLNALMDLAEPPLGIPVEMGEHIFYFPARYGRLLQGPSALLWNFSVGIYPAKVVGSTLVRESAIDIAFDAFHEARGLHSKAWNRFASQIYELGTASLESTVRRFTAHRRLVNLLTYLELALDQWTEDQGEGKRFLFRLNRDWDLVGRRP